MLLNVAWPSWLPQTRRDDKYESVYIFDIQDVFDEGNLDTWLRMADLPPKTASGADAPNMSTEELSRYVAADVDRERRLVRKILPHINQHCDLFQEEIDNE